MTKPSIHLCVTSIALLLAIGPFALLSNGALLADETQMYNKWIATSEPLSPEESHKRFRLPEGFEIQLVAAEPDIYKPFNIAFDTRGRLWTANTTEYPFPAASDRPARDRITILEDNDGDGRADRTTTFAEGLDNPTGLLPVRDGAIVFNIPKIQKLIDHDGDDRADERIDLYGDFDLHDTHGLVSSFALGFDGWIYACHSFGNESYGITGKGDWSVDVIGGNVIRFRPDGSRLQHHSRGQVNPYGLCVDRFGHLYSADCHTRPVYLLQRGAYYPRFGTPHDGMGFGPEICDHKHTSTGICGVVYYEADSFPESYRETIYTGNVVTNRIECDRLVRDGATFRAEHRPDFLNSDDPWFRPVDLKLGPDGALYIADFYNRIIGHWEVPLSHPGRDRYRGRIWRVVYTGADAAGHGAGDVSRLSLFQLVDTMGSPNLALRRAATREVVERVGKSAVESLRLVVNAMHIGDARRVTQSIWALERLGALDGGILQAAVAHADPLVRAHAVNVMRARSPLRESERQLLLRMLSDDDGVVVNAAVTALLDHPRADQVCPLVDLLERIPESDTLLRHATRLSLRAQLRLPASWAALVAGPTRLRDLSAVFDVIMGVRTAESAEFLLNYVVTRTVPKSDVQKYVRYVATYIHTNQLARLVTWVNQQAASTADSVRLLSVLGAALRERDAEPPSELHELVTRIAQQCLESNDVGEREHAMELVRSFRLHELRDSVLAIALDRTRPDGVRRSAYNALFRIDPDAAIDPLAEVLFDGEESRELRMEVITLLARIKTRRAQEILAKSLHTVPFRLGRWIVGKMTHTQMGGELFIREIAAGRASPRLLLARDLHPRLERFGLNVDEIITPLLANLPDPVAEFQKLIAARRDSFAKATPDPTRGAQVFEKNCAACHRIGETGARFAPELNSIGLRGPDRLMEDVLDPNRNIDDTFRASLVVLKNGASHTGLVQRDPGPVLILINAKGEEVRIPKSDVAQNEVLRSSPMPSNFSESLPEQEFNDLLGFLLQQRVTPKKTD